MVIYTDKYYIPFEVKIWAGDQKRQLADYYDFAKLQKKIVPAIYYLTPYGHKPSDQSWKGLENCNIRCISFREHILPWLGECIKILKSYANPSPGILEIMEQMHWNIEKNVLPKDVKYVLSLLQNRLLENDVNPVESAPHIIFTLNKKDELEFALHISRENAKEVQFNIICGVEQAGGKIDYSGSTASKHIDNNKQEYENLLKSTFTNPSKIKLDQHGWSRSKKTLTWPENEDIDEFLNNCYKAVCCIIQSLCEDIKLKFREMN
jgi:hypothetical protein